MRQLIIIIVFLLPYAVAYAKPQCQSFNNHDDKVTIVFTDDNPGKKYAVSDIKLVTSGREYNATSVKVDIKENVATVILTFPHITRFSNPRVKLRINGKKTRFNVCH